MISISSGLLIDWWQDCIPRANFDTFLWSLVGRLSSCLDCFVVTCRFVSANFMFPVDLSFWCLYTPFNIQEISQVGMKSTEKPERQCNFPTLSSCSFEAVSDINFPLRSSLH